MLNHFTKAIIPAVIVCISSCGSNADSSLEDSDQSEDNDQSETSDQTNDTSDGDSTDEPESGKTTGATCPSDDVPTYDNFGAAFLAAHCTRCHSSTKSGAARNGATPNYDFDTLEGVIQHAEAIESVAASGPADTNTFMPPSSEGPSVEQRARLGQWLMCLITGVETAE